MSAPTSPLIVRHLGTQPYEPVWQAMRRFTAERDEETADELWLLEHRPVYTLGQAGRREHLLAPGEIPVVACDRGGQVTYHGPGQLVAYTLWDIHRLGLGVRALVSLLEEAVVALLAGYGVESEARPGAPGVYVAGRKVAALGLRVRRGRVYHGLSLNVAMDLSPFGRIDPCGYPGLEVTQLADLGCPTAMDMVSSTLVQRLVAATGHRPLRQSETFRETP